MIGLALEGGGARGAFHMGVIKAFLEEGYDIGGVTGTSIGALNGAILAQGSFEEGYKMWQKIVPSDMFDVDDLEYKKFIDRDFDRESALQFAARISKIIRNKGIDTGKIKLLLQGIIDEEKLRNSPMDFGLVTISLSGFKPLELYKEEIPKGMMIDFLIASANFPGFKLKEIEDKYYIDGGLYDNCPINLLARKGYKEIYAVRTLGPGFFKDIKYPDVKVTHIMPSENLGKIFNFNQDLIDRNLKMGYFDAMRNIKGLRGVKYYITPPEEESFHRALYSMPDNSIAEMGKLFGLGEMNPKRLLFEKILPEIGNKLGLKSDADYADIVVDLLERLAEEEGVMKYEIYTMDGFLNEIKKKGAGRMNKPVLNDLKSVIKARITDSFTGKFTLLKASQIMSDGIKAI